MSDSFCVPMDYSPSGFSVQGIFQARILEQVAISFSRGSSSPKIEPASPTLASGFFTTEPPGKPRTWFQFSSVQSLSRVWLLATPWIAARQASLSITNSRSSLKLMSIESGWTPGVGNGQGGLACCDSWGCKESDTTERLDWTELKLLTEDGKCWLKQKTKILLFKIYKMK